MTVTYTCGSCQAEFNSANELIAHCRDEHGVKVD